MNNTNSEKIALAKRLSLARKQAGLTQGQVAKLLNLHRPAISEIEAGRRKTSAEELSSFSQIYGVSVDWLVGIDHEKENQLNDQVKLAARELAKLKDDDLEKILNLLAALRKK